LLKEEKEVAIDNNKSLIKRKQNKFIRIAIYLIIALIVIFIINKIAVAIILNNEKNLNTDSLQVGVITEDGTKMRSSLNDKFTLKRGEHVYIIEEKDNNYKVKYNNRVGEIKKENIVKYSLNEKKNYTLMADVSGFNFKGGTFKEIEDFELFMLEHNINYVYIRLGGRGYGKEGILYDDSYCFKYVDSCEKLKIPYGFYFIDEALSYEEVDGEIKYINELLKDKKLSMNKLPFGIDIEYNRGSGRGDNSWEQRVPIIQYFIDTLKESGTESIVYANALRASTYLSTLNTNFWIAYYPQTLSLPKTWYSKLDQEAAKNAELMKKTTAWQFSEKGALLSGIGKEVDLSVVKNKFFMEYLK